MVNEENKPGDHCRDSLLAEQLASLEVVVERLESRLDGLERENNSIRADIHDGFLQDAQAALMFLRSPDVSEAAIGRAVSSLETAIVKARTLLGQESAKTDRLEFVQLITAIRSDAIIDSIAVKGDVIGPVEDVAEVVGVSLSRVLCEALRNVAKHSGTLAAEVTIEVNENLLTAEVRDRGCGFDLDSVPGDRFGLSSMISRISELGGQLWIETDKGMGTSVKLRIPLAG